MVDGAYVAAWIDGYERAVQAAALVQALAVQLQVQGAASFVKSWHSLMAVIASKSATLTAAT